MNRGPLRPNSLIPDFFIADLVADALGPAKDRGPSRLGRASRSLWRGVRHALRRPRPPAVPPSEA